MISINTACIEGVEALEGIKEMPHGGGVFFLEEFGIRGATAFTDFLLDGGEELLCPLEYGIAAGVSRTGIAQQGFESFGSRIKVALIFQQEGFSKSWLGKVRVGLNRYLEPVRKELVFEAGHFTCSPFFRTSPNNYGFCLLCLLSAQKNHIFERELAQLDFFLRFLDVFSAESGRLG